ncbi:hypothetical protein E8E11_004556 [Didymella keratinophila]|nr:hypothetical protein E8E11_004556 [Didymella keratinophila]
MVQLGRRPVMATASCGRDPEESNDEGPQNFVIVLEYEDEFLYTWLLVVAFGLGVFSTQQQEYCKECSAKTRE